MRTVGHFVRVRGVVIRAVLVLAGMVVTAVVGAQSLNQSIAGLKEDVLQLNKDLFELEREVLYPANTQIAVYVSVKSSELFVLDSVELALDDKPAATYLYSDTERKAFRKGGVQRFYVGNLSAGEHRLKATLNGQGVNDHYFRKEVVFTVKKGDSAQNVELVISDLNNRQEPTLSLKEWD